MEYKLTYMESQKYFLGGGDLQSQVIASSVMVGPFLCATARSFCLEKKEADILVETHTYCTRAAGSRTASGWVTVSVCLLNALQYSIHMVSMLNLTVDITTKSI